MATLDIDISTISDLALQITKSVLAANEKTQEIPNDDSGPIAVVSALEDFFGIASALEHSGQPVDPEQLSEIGAYGLDLLDRLAFLVRKLEIMDQQDNLARVQPGIAIWLARRDAVLDNLDGAAEGIARIANGLNDTGELTQMCHLIEELLQAASERLEQDEDQSNPWRPWRILNLNEGVVATRALDPELMERSFEAMGRRLPNDMADFFADGQRQMIAQNVPEPVREIMTRYADKWSNTRPH